MRLSLVNIGGDTNLGSLEFLPYFAQDFFQFTRYNPDLLEMKLTVVLLCNTSIQEHFIGNKAEVKIYGDVVALYLA